MDKAASTGHSDRCRIVVDTCCDFSRVAANLDVDILGFPFIIDGGRTDDIWSSMSPKSSTTACAPAPRVHLGCVARSLYQVLYRVQRGTPTVYLCFTSGAVVELQLRMPGGRCRAPSIPNFELYVVDNALPCATTASSWRSGRAPALGRTDCQAAGRLGKRARPTCTDTLRSSFDALAAAACFRPRRRSSWQSSTSARLSYDLAGSLSLIGVNRGRKKALKSILKSFRENYVPDRTMPIAIMTADADKDGDWLEAAIRKEEGCADVTIIRSSVGPTIGSHVGPGMVALAFWGKNRADKASLSDRIARRVRGQ